MNFFDKYDWGTGYPGSRISHVSYAEYERSWKNRGGTQNQMNLVAANSGDMVITDVEGNPLAQVVDGELITDRTDIIPDFVCSGTISFFSFSLTQRNSSLP